jgi:hypothetical protein
MFKGQYCPANIVGSVPVTIKKERIYEKTTGKAWETIVVSCTHIDGIPARVVQTWC